MNPITVSSILKVAQDPFYLDSHSLELTTEPVPEEVGEVRVGVGLRCRVSPSTPSPNQDCPPFPTSKRDPFVVHSPLWTGSSTRLRFRGFLPLTLFHSSSFVKLETLCFPSLSTLGRWKVSTGGPSSGVLGLREWRDGNVCGPTYSHTQVFTRRER